MNYPTKIVQLDMPADLHRLAKIEAVNLDISLAEYYKVTLVTVLCTLHDIPLTDYYENAPAV